MTTRSPRRFGRALGVALACLLALTLMTSSTAMAGFPWLEDKQTGETMQIGDGPDAFGVRDLAPGTRFIVDDADPQIRTVWTYLGNGRWRFQRQQLAGGRWITIEAGVIIDDGSPF